MDFSKAFDKVNHRILIQKLEEVGVFGDLLGWFGDYLVGHTQVVKINNVLSSTIEVTSGVPQGSHLAPILFNIYINDIYNYVDSSNLLLFADDLKIFNIVNTVDDCMRIQEDISGLCLWCQLNGMQFNVEKCKIMQFYRKKAPILYDYVIGDSSMERLSVIRDLGVLFDRELSFNEHIDYIVNKAIKTLGFIKRTLSDFNSLCCFKVLYCSYVRSIVEYASTVWTPYYQKYIEQLERVQKRFLRFVAYKMKIPMEQLNYADIQQIMQLDSLKNRRVMNDLCTLYKIVNSHVNSSELLEKISFHIKQRDT